MERMISANMGIVQVFIDRGRAGWAAAGSVELRLSLLRGRRSVHHSMAGILRPGFARRKFYDLTGTITYSR